MKCDNSYRTKQKPPIVSRLNNPTLMNETKSI